MVNRRWSRAFVLMSLLLTSGFGCGRSDPTKYGDILARELQKQTVLPGASRLTMVGAGTGPCAIRRQWRFATDWNRARYGEWLKSRLSLRFTVVRDAPGELTFSRHDGGDTHSLTIETPPAADSLRVRVTLCVYPD